GRRRYRMPLAVSFVLIGFFLWLAENAGTLLGAWQYPNQVQIWEMVHAGKWGSWALLVSLSFMLVAVLKTRDGSVRPRRRSPEATLARRSAHPAPPDQRAGPPWDWLIWSAILSRSSTTSGVERSSLPRRIRP